AYFYPVLAMKLGPCLNQAVIADGVTVRRTTTGDGFDAGHHLQFTVIGRKFCKEVRDKRKEILALSGNATTRVADDAPRVNLDCGFATDRFDVGFEFRMHRDSFPQTQFRTASCAEGTNFVGCDCGCGVARGRIIHAPATQTAQPKMESSATCSPRTTMPSRSDTGG